MPTVIKDIELDKRYARMSAAYAITDIYDALVEIITNCDDSYHRLFGKGHRQKDGGDILIQVERHRTKPSRVIVSDKAEGLTRADMDTKFGSIGKRTSQKGDRGFMARGIKDCISLGTITVQSIVDDKYYSCTLSEGPQIALEDAMPVTSEQRRKLGIKKNGTVVTLECSSLPQLPTLERGLALHYALRDILAKSSATRVRIIHGNSLKAIHSPETLYSGNPTYSEIFSVDGYPNSKCDLKIWKHPEALRDEDTRSRNSGILVKGKRAIHQCWLFGYENEAKHYTGRLICPYIDQLLEMYETRSEKMMLVDPSRQQGLNKNHPFTKNLTKKVESVLRDLLEKDKAETAQKSGNIENAEMRKRLDALARAADKLWKSEFDEGGLSDEEGRALDMAEDRGAYILPPRFNIKVGGERSLSLYVNAANYDKKRKTRVESSDPAVLDVIGFGKNEKLSPHPERENVMRGTIKVTGNAIGRSVVTVHPSKTTEVKAIGEVIEHGKPEDIHVFPKGISIEFERKKYQVIEGKEKNLKIFVKNTQKQQKSNVVSVSSDKPEVVILGGHNCKLAQTPHQYAIAEVCVEGRDLTERNRPATVTAKLGGKIAKTKVTVIHKKHSSGRFSFKLTQENLGRARARWGDLEDKPNQLEISAVHPSLQPYFGPGPDFAGQKNPDALALIAELVTENLCIKILREEMVQRSGAYKFDNMQPHEVLNMIVDRLQEKIHEFSSKAHKIMVGNQTMLRG